MGDGKGDESDSNQFAAVVDAVGSAFDVADADVGEHSVSLVRAVVAEQVGAHGAKFEYFDEIVPVLALVPALGFELEVELVEDADFDGIHP